MNKRWIALGMIATTLNQQWKVGKSNHYPLFLTLFESYPQEYWIIVQETLSDNKEDLI